MRNQSFVLGVLALAVCLIGLAMGTALAQDDANQQGSTGGQDAAGEFDKLFAEWRTKLDAMRKLQVEYKQAELADQDAMEQQFEKLLGEAQEMSVQLQDLIEDAYRANPEDKKKGDFLISMAYAKYQEDNFEEASRITTMLLSAGTDVRGVVLDLAAQSQYLLNNYEEAQKLISEAETELAKIQRPLSADAQDMKLKLDEDRAVWQEEVAFRAADEKPAGDPMELPRVELETTKGKVVIELFENEAPNTVANFITLVRDGKYNETPFHRVIAGFMAQGGDPNGDGSGDAGYNIPFESNEEPYRKHIRGAVAMAHEPQAKDTAGTQFYIVYRRDRTRHLDGEHTVFGRVIEGMDVVTQFNRPEPGSPDTAIAEPDRIVSARVLNARDHEYTFRKVGDPDPTTSGGTGDADSGAGDSGTGDTGTGDTGSGGDAGGAAGGGGL